MILQSQMYLWVILVVKLSSTQELLQLTILDCSYCRWCCNDCKILDGTILAADIAADAVTTAKILDGTILAADIATDAVTTVKIADANVTTARSLMLT
jgi:hypothetical protein